MKGPRRRIQRVGNLRNHGEAARNAATTASLASGNGPSARSMISAYRCHPIRSPTVRGGADAGFSSDFAFLDWTCSTTGAAVSRRKYRRGIGLSP